MSIGDAALSRAPEERTLSGFEPSWLVRGSDEPRGTQGGSLIELLVNSTREHGILILDLEARIRSWNAGAEALTGYPADEVTGLELKSLLGPVPGQAEQLSTVILTALRGGYAGLEGWWLRRDGSQLWGSIDVSPMRDGDGTPIALATVFSDLTAWRTTHTRLQEQEECFRSLFENSPDGIIAVDLEGRISSANPASDTLLSYSHAELIGRPWAHVFDPEYHDSVRHAFARAVRGETCTLGVRIVRQDGGVLPARTTLIPLVVGGQTVGVFSHVRAIPEEAALLHALREAQDRAHAILEEHTRGFTYVLDRHRRIRYVSPSVREAIGLDPAQLVGHPLPVVEREAAVPASRGSRGAARHTGLQGRWSIPVEVELLEVPIGARSGGACRGFARLVPRSTDEVLSSWSGLLHDPLTGLANRVLFRDRLDQTIRLAERHPTRKFAVIMVDIDRLKAVNQARGHPAGDAVLAGVARRLEECVRATDTVCRWGDDEFAVLLDDMQDESDASRIAERVTEAFTRPLVVEEQAPISVSAGLGIALSVSGYAVADDLIQNAEAALYNAKRRGPGQVETAGH